MQVEQDLETLKQPAPVTTEWAEKIGADGYANNAPEAVEVAKKLLGASA